MIWKTFYVVLMTIAFAPPLSGQVGARDKLTSGEAGGRMGRGAVKYRLPETIFVIV